VDPGEPQTAGTAGTATATGHGTDGTVNFDLVLEHYCNAFQGDGSGSDRDEAIATSRAMIKRFETEQGTIRSQAWCVNVRAGAVLTSRDRYFAAGNPFRVKSDLDLAGLSTEIDRLAWRAQDLLRNPMRRNSLQQLFGVKKAVLEGLDELAARDLSGDAALAKRSLTEKRVSADLKVARDYTEAAIRRRSQLMYLSGMVLGVVVVAIATGLLMWIVAAPGLITGTETIPTALFLGGLGAVISVMQRLTRGRLRTSLDNGLIVCILLGAFRPVIGGVLAVAIILMVLGGLIPLEVPEESGTRLFFLAGVSFFAGFSERFAQDMFATARGVGSSSTEEPATATSTAEAP
jgi:hypothetical protein